MADNENKENLCLNFIGGEYVDSDSQHRMDVIAPATGEVITQVVISTPDDVEIAVQHAKEAYKTWSALTVKARVKVLFNFHRLLQEHADELADLIVLEHGKTKAEALGSVAKGNETVEYAISMPQLIQGRILEVSRGVQCEDRRIPLGVVASVVPFNFPAMVPLWTLPIAIACGNCYILKPSEKVPLTANRMVGLLKEAGLPDGVVQLVNGTVDVVNAMCDHPDIKALTFVGSTRVAKIVASRCRQNFKRVLALGGAKNHLVALPDCNLEMAADDIRRSFCGCSGQRCMAASVLLTVGDQKPLLDRIVELAGSMAPGSENGCVGPVIDQASLDRIVHYINDSEERGANILLDGRSWVEEQPSGFWIGPTIILHHNREDPALHDEIFGPVLSVLQVESKEEAIEVENANPYGNAACVYTSIGENAKWFSDHFSAAMIGVNIGVPVPREPFSFGGQNDSKFGDFDITGDGGMEFFTMRRKVTTKWTPPPEKSWLN